MAPMEPDPEQRAAMDRHEAEFQAYLESSRKLRFPFRLKFDEDGHAIRPTEAENAAATEALLRSIAEMAAIPDDPLEPDEVFWRAMDEGRPDCPLFKEYYEP